MRIDIRLSQADFEHALSEFLPVTIWLEKDHSRWVHIGAPLHVSVDKEVGVRLIAPVKVKWAAQLELERAHVTMQPEIAPRDGGHELVFHLALEDASFKGLPGLFDGAIVKAVNAALDRTHLAWSYTDTLNRTFPMGTLFDDVTGVRLEAGAGKQETSGDVIILTFQLQVGFTRK